MAAQVAHDAATPLNHLGCSALCLINAAEHRTGRSAGADRKKNGPYARLRPPFDDESSRELDRQRARDGLVLWRCRLGLVEGSKALQRTYCSYTRHPARRVRGGRVMLLVVYGDA